MEDLWQQRRKVRRRVYLAHEDVAHLRLPPSHYGAVGEIPAIAVEVVHFEIGEELEPLTEYRVIVAARSFQFGEHFRPDRPMAPLILVFRPWLNAHEKRDALHAIPSLVTITRRDIPN